jgi:predicted unusual protein kinase regulating ubiquinone biosynthesis (AarF/ABC1/UbiB family)
LKNIGMTDVSLIGAGSMARIYKVQWKKRSIVVKITQPNILDNTKIDVKIMDMCSGFCKSNTGMHNTGEVLECMNAIMLQECELVQEGLNLSELSRIFPSNSSIKIPEVYLDISDGTKLFMEYIDGVQLADFYDLNQLKENRHKIAQWLLEFLFISLRNGVWYSDVNGGCAKVICDSDGTVSQLAMLDFGSCIHLPLPLVEAFINFCLYSDNLDAFKSFLNVLNYKYMKQENQVQDLWRLFSLYIKPFAQDEVTNFSELIERKQEYKLIMKEFNKKEINGPKETLLFLRWFDQISQMMFRLGVSLNFHQIIRSVTMPPPPKFQ